MEVTEMEKFQIFFQQLFAKAIFCVKFRLRVEVEHTTYYLKRKIADYLNTTDIFDWNPVWK